MKNTKKCSGQIGFAIITMAILLLVGSIFIDDNDNSFNKTNYLNNKNNNNNNTYPEDNYLFYLNKTNLGKQTKITDSFPNINIGSKEKNNIIYMENNFKIKANPFSKTHYSFNINLNNPDNLKKLLLYFNLDKISGKQDLVIKVNNKTYYKNQARSNEIPIILNYHPNQNQSSAKITFEIDKPKFYQLFNWNSYQIKELKIVANTVDKSNNIKNFNFDIDNNFLKTLQVNLIVDCKETSDNIKPVNIEINDYTIADFTPNCNSRYNTITREIPLNIIKSKKNLLKIKTEGYYDIAYNLNKIYFNDKETYKFDINSFNDVIDVVMYGDFNKEIIDIRINEQTLSLKRNEIKSIIPYLEFGTNKIEFLNKPLEIDEFIIEKNEFLTYNN